MGYLIAVVLLNTLLFSIFKLFPKFNINALQAISVNYWVCVITGILVAGKGPVNDVLVDQPWFISSLLLGVFLITLFNLIAYSTKKEGITATTIANKLSLMIPVVAAYFLYDEEIGWWKIAGLILSVPAVFLASYKKDRKQNINFLLPVVIFIGSGLMDTFMKYAQHHYLDNNEAQMLFSTMGFMVAALIGTGAVLFQVVRKSNQLHLKNVIAGIILGVPNYFSIYYFIRMVDSDFMQSSATIPVNNIGIVCTTTIVAIFLFREKATKLKLAGVLLSVIAIVFIALSEF